MTPQQLNLLAAVSLAGCWGACALTWLAGAIYSQSRAPEERTRAWFGSAAGIGLVIVTVVSAAVPAAAWRSLAALPPWIRILGRVILLATTTFTLWARLALGAGPRDARALVRNLGRPLGQQAAE